MQYIYGPVKSRRLGLSLGISLTPQKVCSFDCAYCQLGKTTQLTVERKEYIPIEEIFKELQSWLENNIETQRTLSYITLSGAGEPTLNTQISQLISQIKKNTSVPVAVITNSSLLNSSSVRQELLAADLIVPSLDAVTVLVFQTINKPLQEIKIEEIIEGLVTLRKEYKGKIWLEIMLVKGLNDDIRQIKKLKEVIDRINPDKIQINSPVRLKGEPGVLPVEKNKLEKIREILGDKCEII